MGLIETFKGYPTWVKIVLVVNVILFVGCGAWALGLVGSGESKGAAGLVSLGNFAVGAYLAYRNRKGSSGKWTK